MKPIGGGTIADNCRRTYRMGSKEPTAFDYKPDGSGRDFYII
jgi:hypothetical protein